MTREELLELAELLLPNIDKTPEYYENLYPMRNLKDGAIVTRFAPSPTGVVHMGSLYASFVATQFAKQTDGVFYLRIEDTDQKRLVENGIQGIIDGLNDFGFTINEGPNLGGNYGPYIQSQRQEIYQAYIKDLIRKGKAYPCFCIADSLTMMRKEQEMQKQRIGYYGAYAKCRHLSFEEIKNRILNKEPFIIRLKSPGDFQKKVVVEDCIKGKVEFPENDMDIVIMKADGLPTYHFAHAIDDHLMRTTHVIRGDEWLSSVPVHIQLFEVLGFNPPHYAHLAPINKKDGETVRKLSKRKDPEANVAYYHEEGIPDYVVKLYLATLASSDFEAWYSEDPTRSIDEFNFKFDHMSQSGALFDVPKLMNISKLYFSRLKATEIYEKMLMYYEQYDKAFATIIKEHKDDTIEMLNIEREIERPRKDIASYKDVKTLFWYFYDELFDSLSEKELYQEIDKKYNVSLLTTYLEKYYQESDTKEEWFAHMKEFAQAVGYAPDVKTYKKDKESYPGHVGDLCEMVRVAITTKNQTPDLYEIMNLFGKERITKRINKFIQYMSK